ncbi:MAG TPA: GNAT family N-acetyltransferase [Ktedonobacterales bacterium]
MASFRVRAGAPEDLPAVHTIWYRDEVADDPQPPAKGPVLSGFTYELEHGALCVAEDDTGQIIGFGGSVGWDGPRGPLTYLADLFIAPDAQSRGVGQAILRALPLHAGGRCVHASTDPRAAALYIRTGMLPLWPNLWLVGDPERGARGLGALPGADITLVEAAADDPELATWDLRHFGYARPRDLAWLVASRDAQPFWFQRAGATIGYGFVQRRCPESLWRPGAWTLGPIGAATPADACDCVCAATRWASERAGAARIGVPGPHLALAPLIEAGCHLVYNETFLASPGAPLPDVTRYLPSGVFL